MSCFQKAPHLRKSAKELLKHPWIKNRSQKPFTPSPRSELDSPKISAFGKDKSPYSISEKNNQNGKKSWSSDVSQEYTDSDSDESQYSTVEKKPSEMRLLQKQLPVTNIMQSSKEDPLSKYRDSDSEDDEIGK